MFGGSGKLDLTHISIKNIDIQWIKSLHYLGVYIVSGAKPTISYTNAKRTFYVAFNSVISHTNLYDQPPHLSLIDSYCLPPLTCVCGVFHFSQNRYMCFIIV